LFSDARQFAEKTDHVFSEATLSATLLDSWPDVEPCAIKVTGFNASTPKDTIGLYFASRNVSKGEEPEEVLYDAETRTAVITYESSSG